MSINQSFSWWCFAGRDVPDEVILSRAREIGYQAVELLPDDKLHLAAKHELVIASHPGHRLTVDGLNNLDCHAAIEATILSNIEMAQKHRIPTLIVFSGERMPGHTDEEGIEN